MARRRHVGTSGSRQRAKPGFALAMAGDRMNTAERGAWYTDPYGTDAQERWWDGSRWTNHVRDKPPDAAPPAIRSAAPPVAAASGSFRRSFDEFVGEDLRLQALGTTRFTEYELVSGSRQTVASLRLTGLGELARMECSEGEWRLLKRRRLGWELIVENADGHVVAWYSGRKWRTGGTIFLRAGPQLDLVKSVMRPWTLQTVEREDPVMRMHASDSPIRVDCRASAASESSRMRHHQAVLTACRRVPLLEVAGLRRRTPPGP